MAKKPKKPKKPVIDIPFDELQADEKLPRGRSRELGLTDVISIELPRGLAKALADCGKAERRTKTAVVILALERYLTAGGHWQADSST